MKSKKNYKPIICAAVISVFLLACFSYVYITLNTFKVRCEKFTDNNGAGGNSISVEYISSEEDYTFETAVNNSTTAVIAEFVSSRISSDVIEFEFVKKEVLYGNAPEETLVVNSTVGVVFENGEVLDENTFTCGETYLLTLYRINDLFLPCAHYNIIGETFIPMGSLSQASFKGGKILISGPDQINNFKNYVKEIAEEQGYSSEIGTDVFRTEGLEYVTKNCDLIIKVHIDGTIAQGVLSASTTYEGEYIESFKGVCYENEYGKIFINTTKNALSMSNDYIILLSRISETSPMYSQASYDSIISVDDTETIEQIKTWLSETE